MDPDNDQTILDTISDDDPVSHLASQQVPYGSYVRNESEK